MEEVHARTDIVKCYGRQHSDRVRLCKVLALLRSAENNAQRRRDGMLKRPSEGINSRSGNNSHGVRC